MTNVGKKRYSQLVNDVRGNLDKAFADAEHKYHGNKEHEAIRAKQKEEMDRVNFDPKYQTDISRRFDEAGKRHTDALEKARNGKTFFIRRQGKKNCASRIINWLRLSMNGPTMPKLKDSALKLVRCSLRYSMNIIINKLHSF